MNDRAVPLAAGLAVSIALTACNHAVPAPELAGVTLGTAAISATPGFSWLPPIVPSAPAPAQPFDGTRSPSVDICALGKKNVCTPVTSLPAAAGQNQYTANWTATAGLKTGVTYRIGVRVGTQTLGTADVDVVRSQREADRVNRAQYVPLIVGQPLSINFYLEGSAPPAGTLDPSFGTGGVVTTAFPEPQAIDELYGMALQTDGKVVAAGRIGLRLGVARYLADGTLDASFGSGGYVSVREGFTPRGVAVQPDGKIVVVGFCPGQGTDGNQDNLFLARFGADGSLDGTFGSLGIVELDSGGNDGLFAVALQSDGNIIAVGEVGQRFAIVRYTTSGAPDAGFGQNGVSYVEVQPFTQALAYAVVIQPDGRIVAGGHLGGAGDFLLARVDSSGTLDASFGTGGVVTTDFYGQNDELHALALRPDGRILAAGWVGHGAWDAGLAQYSTDGSIDASFGTGGRSTARFGSEGSQANGVALQADGKAVVATWRQENGQQTFTVARFDESGSLDTSFGTNGAVISPVVSAASMAHAVVVQPDGRILAAGWVDSKAGYRDFALVRYLP